MATINFIKVEETRKAAKELQEKRDAKGNAKNFKLKDRADSAERWAKRAEEANQRADDTQARLEEVEGQRDQFKSWNSENKAEAEKAWTAKHRAEDDHEAFKERLTTDEAVEAARAEFWRVKETAPPFGDERSRQQANARIILRAAIDAAQQDSERGEG